MLSNINFEVERGCIGDYQTEYVFISYNKQNKIGAENIFNVKAFDAP